MNLWQTIYREAARLNVEAVAPGLDNHNRVHQVYYFATNKKAMSFYHRLTKLECTSCRLVYSEIPPTAIAIRIASRTTEYLAYRFMHQIHQN